MSKESKLMKNTAIIALGNICTKFISFFMLPLYTSLLSTYEYGTVDLLGTTTSLLAIIITLQFEQGIFRYLIEYRNDQKKQTDFLNTGITAYSIFNVIFLIIMICILTILKYDYTFYLVLSVFLSGLNSIVLQITRGIGDNVTYAIASFINGSLNVALNVVFIAFLHLNINGILLATIISLLASSLYVVLKTGIYKRMKFSIENDCLKKLRDYSFPLIFYTLTWWIISASDRIIINYALGTSFNGIYSVAHKFPTLFTTATNIFQLSWTESASENVKDRNRDSFYQKIINQTIRLYSSCALGLICTLPFLFKYLVKNDFVKGYDLVPILIIAALFHSISALYGSVYFALKKTKEVSKTTMLAAIINIVVNILLIKKIGLFAAAGSSLIAYFVITIIRHLDLKQKINIHGDIKYYISEFLMYIFALIAYYINNEIMNIISFIIIVSYCINVNKKFLIKVIFTKFKGKK